MDPAPRAGLISYFSVLMIDHNVMRFHVSVHDAFAVAEVQRLEKLENVETDVEVVEFGIEASEIDVVDVLEDERRGLTLHEYDMSALSRIKRYRWNRDFVHLRVPHYVEQRDNVGSACEILQDLDLTLDLLLLNRLENLDDAFLVVDHIDSLKHFRVLSPT
jgi:hypothetical protein